jgi:iron complex transport system substrate-binding protein
LAMTFHAPRRIVSYAPVLTEVLSYLGLSEHVTTVPEYFEDIPPVTDHKKPEYWFTMALGRAKSLKADLTLTFSIAQQDLYKRLKEKGFNTLHLDPLSLREIEDSFQQIGKVTGTQDAALHLSRDFAGGLAGLAERVKGSAYRPKLYCEDWTTPPSAPGGWYPELMSQAGAHYFPMLPREVSRVVKIEEMFKFDPEIIIFAVRGTQGVEFNPDEVLKRIGWNKITAVKKRRIFTVDQLLLNRPGPRLIEGAKLVQQILGQSFWGWPLASSEHVRKVLD